MFTFLIRKKTMPIILESKHYCSLLLLCMCGTAWTQDFENSVSVAFTATASNYLQRESTAKTNCATQFILSLVKNVASLIGQQETGQICTSTLFTTTNTTTCGDLVNNCPSRKWNAMCRPCCEYHLIECRCPSKGSKVGYTVPCCRNAVDQCDPCIYHPGCSLFENCKTCHNGTWKANDDFFVNGKYCAECRQGWSGGDCKTCGGDIQQAQGHIALESYPTNARCEWRVQVERGSTIELRFSRLSLESDQACRYDHVEVRDGDDLSSPVMGRFCGDRLPPLIKSSGNRLHILFASDGYNNFDGFVLSFQESSGQAKTFHCSPPSKLLNGFHRKAPDTAGDAQTIEFSCRNSYILIGSRNSTCLSNGSWSGRPPKCVRACREPKVSEAVLQSVVTPHHASRHDLFRLTLAGHVPTPVDRRSKQRDAALEELPPGYHPVSTSIVYKCVSPLYHNSGSPQRTCLKTGRWSGRHVLCSPVCGKFDAFSTDNLTDTRSPWHVGIYIRSPPGHTASSHRPPVMTMSGQQGASEESTFWYLSCSGALLTRSSVLVAAHCVVEKDKQQPVHPARIKVAIGIQHHTSKAQKKIQRHLRVSDILVHPRFYSAPDSDVAVLQLQDKAKISEYVLPVCLPEIQGGEVTAQEAYTSRWMLSNDYMLPSSFNPLSQMKQVELGDISQCEREFAKGRAHTTPISDDTLCVISQPSGPESACPRFIPGITTTPAVLSSTSGVLSGDEETGRASAARWQLLGLDMFIYEETNCDRKTYTVQTKIGNFLNWIKKNMK